MPRIKVGFGNFGKRWSYPDKRHPIAERKVAQRSHFARMAREDLLPGIFGGVEVTAVHQEFLESLPEFKGYGFFGNGIGARGKKVLGETDRDRSGDNVFLAYDRGTYDELVRVIVAAGVVGGIGKTYARALRLQRVTGGKPDGAPFWVAVSHPPAGKTFKTLRMKHVRALTKAMRSLGVDLERLIWVADFNDPDRPPARGVRKLLADEFGLRDPESLLSADDFVGNSIDSSHHYGPSPRNRRKIDFAVIGKRIRARWGRVWRTDTRPYPADHNWILYGFDV